MAKQLLSPPVTEFLTRWIHSVEQLEILCLLSSTPEKKWFVRDVFSKIQSSEKSISEGLQHFVKAGLLRTEGDGSYRFTPKQRKWGLLVAQLRKAYQERRVSIIELIYSTSPPIDVPPGQASAGPG